VEPFFTPGARLYCVGDIHGRADLLACLHQLILEDATDYAGRKKVLYLGDYIDRGQQSREVIDLLLERPLPGFEQIHLMGNHEKALLDFLEFPDHAGTWLNFGGLATLLSYGVTLERVPSQGSDLVGLAVALRRQLPDPHLRFLENLPFSYREAAYCFAHAGIRPGVPLERQSVNDLLWIRDEFTRHGGPHEAIVVHGHTISEQPELLPFRIGIDTGAYFSGVLTCLVLEGREQRILQTGQAGAVTP
jgi:serine/threonine protein phosphatase 1